jgi:hypothetical protein
LARLPYFLGMRDVRIYTGPTLLSGNDVELVAQLIIEHLHKVFGVMQIHQTWSCTPQKSVVHSQVLGYQYLQSLLMHSQMLGYQYLQWGAGPEAGEFDLAVSVCMSVCVSHSSTAGPVNIQSPSSVFWGKQIHQTWSRIPKKYVKRANN